MAAIGLGKALRWPHWGCVGLSEQTAGYHGIETINARAGSHLDSGTEGQMVAQRGISGKYATADHPLRDYRHVAGRNPQSHQPVRGNSHWLDPRGWHHFGDSRFCDVQNSFPDWPGKGNNTARKQRHAIHRHGSRVYDRPSGFLDCGVYADYRPNRSHASDHSVDDFFVDSRCAFCLSPETTIHQR